MKLPAILHAIALALCLAGPNMGCRPTDLRLRLRSDAQTNGGRPLIVMLRRVTSALPFRREHYSEIERLVITPDASVLRVLSMPPGVKKPLCVTIPYPTQGDVALYALYSAPVADWRVLFAAPVPDRIDLVLHADGIDRTKTREHRPLRLPRPPALPKGLPEPTLPTLPTVKTPSLPGGSQ